MDLAEASIQLVRVPDLLGVAANALLVSLFAYFVLTDGRWWRRSLRFLDAVALGTWGAVGAQKALNAGLDWLPAILLGTLTAVGGGMIRDVLVQRTPVVFGGSTLYATCASIAALVAVVLHGLTPVEFKGVTTLIAALVGGTLCLVAYRRDWRLPEAGIGDLAADPEAALTKA